MNQSRKVTIFTRAYKTEAYLEQCISSVLAQTYDNFEYILFDNGSPDRCGEIIDRYAAVDKRIIPVHFAENQSTRKQDILKYATGYYYTVIDSDDWWEKDYLKRLIDFLENNNLDLAVTGTVNYFQENCTEKIMRELENSVVMSKQEFAQYYPVFWTFLSTVWGNIMKMSLYEVSDIEWVQNLHIPYGTDTLSMLKYLEHCERIGIDNSAMYHYRIHQKSMSYQYNPRRFDGNVVLTEAMRKFLEQHDTFDPLKQEWLKKVLLNSIDDTLHTLSEAEICVQDKVTECIRILQHPQTVQALTVDCDERMAVFHQLCAIVSEAAGVITRSSEEEQIRTILRYVSPDCADGFALEYRDLYIAEASFWTILMQNDRDGARTKVLEWITRDKYTHSFDLGKLLNHLIPEGFLLKNEQDTQFFKTYAESCRLIFENSLDSALEEMTGTLLENGKLYAEERFLKLYLSIAALQNQIPAFLYGNIRLAYFYFDEKRFDDCCSLLDGLEEMGAGEHEDVLQLRQALEKVS